MFGVLRFNEFRPPASVTKVTLELEWFALGWKAAGSRRAGSDRGWGSKLVLVPASGAWVDHCQPPSVCPVRAVGVALLLEVHPYSKSGFWTASRPVMTLGLSAFGCFWSPAAGAEVGKSFHAGKWATLVAHARDQHLLHSCSKAIQTNFFSWPVSVALQFTFHALSC